ncbi:hypothetical protein PABG_12594 [Paracoccidioides brasiliensis Pb03]|nr:hypothetical protein PABG_12594 [Paracoccidioides brasiliensis Pb03]
MDWLCPTDLGARSALEDTAALTAYGAASIAPLRSSVLSAIYNFK